LSVDLNIAGLRQSPGKTFCEFLKVPEFFVIKSVGTLMKAVW